MSTVIFSLKRSHDTLAVTFVRSMVYTDVHLQVAETHEKDDAHRHAGRLQECAACCGSILCLVASAVTPTGLSGLAPCMRDVAGSYATA